MPKTSTECSTACREQYPIMIKKPKTGAERTREYRARQKAFKVGVQTLPSVLITPPPIVNDDTNLAGPSQLNDDTSVPYSIIMPKTSTECSTACREEHRIMIKKPKTAAERTREYRARQKAFKVGVQTLPSVLITPPPIVNDDTNLADPSRLNDDTSVPYSIIMPKTSTECSTACGEEHRIMIKKPKTGAERIRKYRARQKAFKVGVQTLPSVLITPPPIVNDDTNLAGPSRLNDDTSISYSKFIANRSAHREFDKKFFDNPFGFVCGICDHLWFKDDLKEITPEHQQLLEREFPEANFNSVVACKCCTQSLHRNHVPAYAKLNGFSYSPRPAHLRNFDLVSERLTSPRIPFMQIKHLRHAHGQIINAPICVDTMVHHLPRNIDDDHCIYVHIKRRKIHKSSYVSGLISKRNIKAWLQYLLETPLCKFYYITINQSFFNNTMTNEVAKDEISEDIPIEDSLIAQQQTLQCFEFITSNRRLSIFSSNCQSLREHVADLNNKVVKNSKILLLSEACLGNEEQSAVPNFDCEVQVKHSQVKNGGVSIYNNSINNTVVVTANMDINLHQTSSLAVNITNVGDICVARCILDNGQTVLAVVVYISPNQSVKKIIEFIHEVLIVYTPEVSAILKKDYYKLPMILSGDFNVNFASVEARPLVKFLDEKFNLKMKTNLALPRTRAGTSIDAVFARYLDQLTSTVYVSYFSSHKPIISFLNHEEMEIVE